MRGGCGVEVSRAATGGTVGGGERCHGGVRGGLRGAGRPADGQCPKRHLRLEILLIALCTLLSGGASCADMALFGRAKQAFLAEFLTLPHGVPSHDTFSRVFRLLDPVKFEGNPRFSI